MTPLNPLRQFLASWFVDSEGPDGDVAAARRFARTATPAEVTAVLDEAAILLSGDEDTLLATIDREANRYFDTAAKARAWLELMRKAIQQEGAG